MAEGMIKEKASGEYLEAFSLSGQLVKHYHLFDQAH